MEPSIEPVSIDPVKESDLLSNLKAEITKDPEGRYAGKTPKEIADLINTPIVTTTSEDIQVPVPAIVVTETKTITKTTVKDAPVFRVILGVLGAPNLISEEDVVNALK